MEETSVNLVQIDQHHQLRHHQLIHHPLHDSHQADSDMDEKDNLVYTLASHPTTAPHMITEGHQTNLDEIKGIAQPPARTKNTMKQPVDTHKQMEAMLANIERHDALRQTISTKCEDKVRTLTFLAYAFNHKKLTTTTHTKHHQTKLNPTIDNGTTHTIGTTPTGRMNHTGLTTMDKTKIEAGKTQIATTQITQLGTRSSNMRLNLPQTQQLSSHKNSPLTRHARKCSADTRPSTHSQTALLTHQLGIFRSGGRVCLHQHLTIHESKNSNNRRTN